MDQIVFLPLVSSRRMGELDAVFAPKFYGVSESGPVLIGRIGVTYKGRVPAVARMSAVAAVQFYGADVSEVMRAALPEFEFIGWRASEPPAVQLMIANLPFVGFIGEGFRRDRYDATFNLPAFRAFASDAESLLIGELPTISLRGTDAVASDDNYGFCIQSAGYMWAFGAWSPVLAGEGVDLSDAAQGQYRAIVLEAAVTAVAHTVRLNIQRGVAEGASVTDLLLSATRAAIAEGVALADTPAGFARALLHVYDAVSLLNPLASSASITVAVAAGVVLAEVARDMLPAFVAEAAIAADAAAERIRAIAGVIEALLAGDLVGSQVKVIAMVSEATEALATDASQLWALARLSEGATLLMRLRFGGDVYTGWVVNTSTKAVSTYTNYPFNSFAVVGHTAFGASDEGLFELSGDSDNGEQINAAIRTVLTNLGTGRKKRVPDVYLGYTSSGGLVMKVVTTDKSDGERTEDWYKLTEQPAGTMREGRIKPGKGLSSVYWAFEMVNIDGADFEIDKIDLLPIILERRV